LNDIDGNPVVDRGRVYAMNHAGRMVSIDIRSGERVWESNIGGIYTPWIAGNYIFIVTSEAQIAALSLRDGRVRWVTELQRFEDPIDRQGLIRWAGPILAGDRLVIVSSHGYLLSVSPYTGEILSGEEISGGSVIPPIVANQTIYILTSRGQLIAYR
jgi:outer membrane protein assembly factor BamB